ncbi:MAG: calcium/sodium antiporter [Rhodomicrobiaceae bacterium]
MNWADIAWQLPAGIVFLALGGDLLVRGSSTLAERLGMSRLLIGVTLVSFGTSMPEMMASVQAALRDSPGIAVGNVVGSNIANILLVLGAAALIYPLATPRVVMRHNGIVVLMATAVCVGVVLFGHLDRVVGAMLVGLLIGYFVWGYFRDRHVLQHETENGSGQQEGASGSVWGALFLAVAGLALVLLGAHWLVDSSIELAREFDISESIIGLTVVAIGTSLPELITSVIAAFRRETALALGNVLGSNVQNILGILGVTALVHPIDVPADIAAFDIWVMVAATVALLVFATTRRCLSRLEGFLLLLAYVIYIGYLGYIALGVGAAQIPA